MAPRCLATAALAATALSAKLPEFTPELRDHLWNVATEQAKASGGQQNVCGYGTWGDSGQVNQWDQGFSPCWPSLMNIGAAWDVELMARWSVEVAREFGEPNRGQLGPGVNIARYAWNGRLGEYMSGEDPYLGTKMIESQVKAFRQVDRPAVQVVKHWIPNTIETDRNGMTEVIDERTLFEVYYPPFQAAVDAGVSAVMCSYNLIKCTTGLCSTGSAYACANDDILNKHLKKTMGFKGIVMTDWDATHCQEEAAGSGGCSGSYIDGEYAAESGLDMEMPTCMSFAGGVTKRAQEKAARLRWAYLVQGRGLNGFPLGDAELNRIMNHSSAKAVAKHDAKALRSRRLAKVKDQGYCCWWPVTADACGACITPDTTTLKGECVHRVPEAGTWCVGDKAESPVPTMAPPPTVAPYVPAAPPPTLAPYVPPPPPAPYMPPPVAPVAPVTAAPSAEEDRHTAEKDRHTAEEDPGYCCWWPTSADACEMCVTADVRTPKHQCIAQLPQPGTWCIGKVAAPTHAPKQAPQEKPDQKNDNKDQDWQSGIYKDNPFGEAQQWQDPAKAPEQKEVTLYGKKVELCEHRGKDNYNSPCKLDLAARIIAESTVVLKNSDGVLPLSKNAKVALVGEEACSSAPLAQGGGSGWNGFACNSVPKVNVRDGIAGLADGPHLECCSDPDADVVVAVVAPEKAEEGRDRSTLQLFPKDVTMIQKLVAAGKKVVVVINAPGPMITSTWDEGVSAILISWLPGQQNGRGIAMALYGKTHEASGRLPFTFPKCNTKECTKEDELASVHLGDKVADQSVRVFSEKGLIGYRYYHAKNIEVSYPFGFGLFAYGSAEVKYSEASAACDGGSVKVSVTMSHDGPRAGHEVPQMYLSFPSDIPGDASSKPEWILKGFEKRLLKPSTPTEVMFTLTQRDLSYWDDAPGKSLWVCAPGTFKVCVGSNSRDAILPDKGACTTFPSPCIEDPLVVKKDDETVPSQWLPARLSPVVFAASGLASVVFVATAVVGARRWHRGLSAGQKRSIVAAEEEEGNVE
mmetsp:Transcript_62869/g.205228  ORF Transcript_62869/g.205228 Transcript_62869/m.205228 type:complete len:1029 (+) Transcript_62869:94-3180(+)